ncbi:MAG: hypothetical protein KGL39_48885 [Patescibacteria group bacterium]|nr:hypothetical protein [Patescibacteria group bacterium]
MIYGYKDLKGVIRVGDTVRAVPGKYNPCDMLIGGKAGTITHVYDNVFCINGCFHSYSKGSYLDLNPSPTWETLKVGDIIEHEYGDTRKVLAVLGNVFLMSFAHDRDKAGGWSTIAEAQRNGWKLKGADEPTEVTMAEVGKQFGRKVKIIKE